MEPERLALETDATPANRFCLVRGTNPPIKLAWRPPAQVHLAQPIKRRWCVAFFQFFIVSNIWNDVL